MKKSQNMRVWISKMVFAEVGKRRSKGYDTCLLLIG
jgi:hypothetical protein